MIYVIASIDLHEKTRDQFLEEFHRIVPLVLEEKGCVEYGPAVDTSTQIKAQMPLRPNNVTIIEKWESIEDLNAHLVAPHMNEYREKVNEYVDCVNLQILEPA